jgi:hypothetical protein
MVLGEGDNGVLRARVEGLGDGRVTGEAPASDITVRVALLGQLSRIESTSAVTLPQPPSQPPLALAVLLLYSA